MGSPPTALATALKSPPPCRPRSPPRARSWSKSRSSRGCRCFRENGVMEAATAEPAPPAPASDRAPDELAAGVAQPLRGELEALLGPDRLLTSPGDLVRYASDA